MVNEFHNKLHRELEKREKEVREQLKSEFDFKLKKRIQDHEDELKKKKISLEIELQKRMKQVLS